MSELERDPRTGLMVPRFWEHDESELDKVHTDANGDPTIFVSLSKAC